MGLDTVILRSVDLGDGHHWAFEESQYYTLRALCARYAGIDGTREADMGEKSTQTNAMTAAMQGMSIGADPVGVLRKRFREKQNFGMSTLKNQGMPKKAKQVYTPVYERPPKASPRNALAVQIYESMFYNKQRIGVTHGQFRGLQQKVMTAPDEAMSATETIIERLVESGAGEEDKSGPGLGAAGLRFMKVGLQVGKSLAKKTVKSAAVSLRTLGKHVFVAGSSGRALIALAVMFALRATAMVAYDLASSSGTDTDPTANMSTWTQWVGHLWKSATANPYRDGAGLFKSTGLTKKYTSFLASFWDNSTSEHKAFWDKLPEGEFKQLRDFMKHRQIGTSTQNDQAFTDISQLVRYALIDKEAGSTAPKELQPIIAELKELATKESFRYTISKEIDDGVFKWEEVKVENPFQEELSGFASISAGAKTKDGGALLEAQFAIQNQGSTWTLLGTRFALTLARITFRGSGAQKMLTEAGKTYLQSWLQHLPGFTTDGPLVKAMAQLVYQSEQLARWEEFDKMFMICATVTVYTIWNFLRQCMDVKRRYYDGLQADGKTPAPPTTTGEKLVSASNFTRSLTMMVASMSMLYTVLTVGETFLATSGISSASTANFFLTNITAMLVEESVLFAMGYKAEMSGGMFLLNKAAVAFVGIMLNVYLQGQWAWVVNSGLVTFGAVGVTAGRYIWNTAMSSSEGWRKQVATAWRGVKLNPGTYLFDSMGDWMINKADEWEKTYLDVPAGNGGFQNAAQLLAPTGPGQAPGQAPNVTPVGPEPELPRFYPFESQESKDAKKAAYEAAVNAYYGVSQMPSGRGVFGPATTTEDRVKAAQEQAAAQQQQAQEQAAAQQRTDDENQLGDPGKAALSALEKFTLDAQNALNKKTPDEPTLADKVVEGGQKQAEQVRKSLQGARDTFDTMFAGSQRDPTALSRFQQLSQQGAQQSASQDPNLQAQIAQAERELRQVLPANQLAGRAANRRDQIRRRVGRTPEPAGNQPVMDFQVPNFDQPDMDFQAPNFVPPDMDFQVPKF